MKYALPSSRIDTESLGSCAIRFSNEATLIRSSAVWLGLGAAFGLPIDASAPSLCELVALPATYASEIRISTTPMPSCVRCLEFRLTVLVRGWLVVRDRKTLCRAYSAPPSAINMPPIHNQITAGLSYTDSNAYSWPGLASISSTTT
ncbi:unannotated protein [freshwater metagenome]|uniref:Unannotated protein n=1 Tax=freshwater metagenome TaxID=449393 RepID=A0A6J5ZLE8_9ZZZZ